MYPQYLCKVFFANVETHIRDVFAGSLVLLCFNTLWCFLLFLFCMSLMSCVLYYYYYYYLNVFVVNIKVDKKSPAPSRRPPRPRRITREPGGEPHNYFCSALGTAGGLSLRARESQSPHKHNHNKHHKHSNRNNKTISNDNDTNKHNNKNDNNDNNDDDDNNNDNNNNSSLPRPRRITPGSRAARPASSRRLRDAYIYIYYIVCIYIYIYRYVCMYIYIYI